jgi:outer membrane translocation and assembly module TamA
VIGTSSARAQLTDRLTRCFPDPTYAQEVRQLHAEMKAKWAAGYPPSVEPTSLDSPVILDEVTFDADGLAVTDRQRIVTELKQLHLHDGPGWLEELEGAYLADYLKRLGYFRAELSASTKVLRTDSEGVHVALTVVVNAGRQYRMGKLAFRSADPDSPLVFSQADLASRFPLHEGEIFDVSQVRAALESLRTLYHAHGYIDFVATPITEVNDSTNEIDLTMELDQQTQFRVGKLTIYTLYPEVEAAARSAFPPGSIFDSNAIPLFLRDNAPRLPADISQDDVVIQHNVKSGTVDVTMYLEMCPAMTN